MSTQLKLRRGTTAQHSTFTGAEGEVTVDTTKDTLVVHDGTTAGGVPVASTKVANSFTADQVVNGLTVGRGAGAVSTNTAVGASALAANTTGFQNTAGGANALAVNTTGAASTAFGYNALALSTGDANNAFGRLAMPATTTGTNNAAFGNNTLQANTTGSYNVALGANALNANTTASNNTAVGYQAGYANTTGTSNVAVGYTALKSSTTGYSNTAVGSQAGTSSTTGTWNTLIGEVAGYALTTGNSNTLVGTYAGGSLTTGTLNTFVGSMVNGYGCGYKVSTGSKNTIIGGFDGNQGGLDIRTANNYIVLSDGDGNPRAYFNSSGIFINPPTYSNTTASAANLVMGPTGTLERSTSALKYKQDIRDLESMDISLLRPVRYKSKCVGDDQTKDHFGVVADEAAEAGFEELISRGADGEVEGFQYERLTVVLLKELQTLRARVAQLESNP